jgi:single-strand DNA-binding protein
MAGGVNKVILVGNLGSDPELKHTPGGDAVCEFSIATNESWTDKAGQKQERTEWHSIVVWGKRGEVSAKYLSKGRQCYIEGRLRTRSWEDKEGNKRYKTEIVASDVQFLGGKGDGDSGGHGASNDAPPPYSGGGGDDDLPF